MFAGGGEKRGSKAVTVTAEEEEEKAEVNLAGEWKADPVETVESVNSLDVDARLPDVSLSPNIRGKCSVVGALEVFHFPPCR